jgi:single-strand DNA-binding protein
VNLNKIFLAGNLTRDPELRYTPTGDAVLNMGIACNRTYKSKDGEKKQDVAFVNCVAWRHTAELINQYLTKGSPVFVEGRLQSRSWEKDGQKRSVLEVVVENVQFIGKKEPEEKPVAGDASPLDTSELEQPEPESEL